MSICCLDPQDLCKNLGVAVCLCDSGTGKVETGGSLGLALTSQSNQTGKLQVVVPHTFNPGRQKQADL